MKIDPHYRQLKYRPIDSSFWRHVVYADIRRGSLERGRQTTVGLSKTSIFRAAHNIWSNLRLPLGMRKQKGVQLQGAPDPHRGLYPLDSRWGHCPQIPVICTRSALAMGVMPCAVVN